MAPKRLGTSINDTTTAAAAAVSTVHGRPRPSVITPSTSMSMPCLPSLPAQPAYPACRPQQIIMLPGRGQMTCAKTPTSRGPGMTSQGARPAIAPRPTGDARRRPSQEVGTSIVPNCRGNCQSRGPLLLTLDWTLDTQHSVAWLPRCPVTSAVPIARACPLIDPISRRRHHPGLVSTSHARPLQHAMPP